MPQIKAVATLPEKFVKGGKLTESVNYNFPTTLDGWNKTFGADYVLDSLKKSMAITVQAFMRGKMVKKEEGEITGIGLRGAALQAAVDGYKPTLRKAGKSFLDKARDKVKMMSAEERAQLIAELQGSGGPAKAAAPARRTAAPARRPAQA